MPTSCLAFFNACTGPVNSKAPAWAWHSLIASFDGMADGSGRRQKKTRAQRFILRLGGRLLLQIANRRRAEDCISPGPSTFARRLDTTQDIACQWVSQPRGAMAWIRLLNAGVKF